MWLFAFFALPTMFVLFALGTAYIYPLLPQLSLSFSFFFSSLCLLA